MKKIILICLLGLLGLLGYGVVGQHLPATLQLQPAFAEQLPASDKLLGNAYKNKQSDLQVGGTGFVLAMLSDDLKGSCHE